MSFFRLDPNLKKIHISPGYFNDSFAFVGSKGTFSVDFINDSTFIQTGKFNDHRPVVKWDIINFHGFQFLCFHDFLFQTLAIPDEVTKERISFWKKPGVILQRTSVNVSKNALVGKWKVIKVDFGADSFYLKGKKSTVFNSISITADSLFFDSGSTRQVKKWYLTRDGGRIYFDNMYDIGGSWQVVDNRKNKLILKMRRKEAVDATIIYLRR